MFDWVRNTPRLVLYYGTIIQARITCKKILYKSLLRAFEVEHDWL